MCEGAMIEAYKWIVGNDTGRSSKTLWAFMMGAVTTRTECSGEYDTPSDPADFGRCHRLLELMPEWRARMKDMPAVLPKWGPPVREWERLTAIYLREIQFGHYCPSLYEEMKKLDREAMLADGWKQTGRGSWARGKAASVSFGNGVTISTP